MAPEQRNRAIQRKRKTTIARKKFFEKMKTNTKLKALQKLHQMTDEEFIDRYGPSDTHY